jgi:sugar lactone lactonase YvrE
VRGGAGRLLATRAHGDHTVRVWDPHTGKPLHVLGKAENYGYTLAFAPDGRRLLWGDWEGRVHVADPHTGKELTGWEVDPEIKTLNELAFAADGRTLFTASSKAAGPGESRPALFQIWDAAAGKPLLRRKDAHGSYDTACLAVAPDLTAVVVQDRGGILLRDVARGRERVRFQGADLRAFYYVFSPDGKTLATVTYRPVENGSRWTDYTLRLWEVASGKELLAIPTDEDAYNLAFSADGALVASGSAEAIRLWDVATGRPVGRFRGHDARVQCLGFSPDGKTLATGLADSTILIWDLSSLPKVARPAPAEVGPRALAQAWDDLASEDGGRAHRALAVLTADPAKGVALLKGRLRPASDETTRRIRQRIAELDSEDFETRRRASQELEELAVEAEPALLRVIGDNPSPEMRKRVEALLELPRRSPPPETLRRLRSVQALERIASPEAREVLKSVAGGDAEAPLTREARGALDRLSRRAAP